MIRKPTLGCIHLLEFVYMQNAAMTSFYNMMSYLPPTFQWNGEGNVFTGICPCTPVGGGYPIQLAGGGTPSFLTGGTPILPDVGLRWKKIPKSHKATQIHQYLLQATNN